MEVLDLINQTLNVPQMSEDEQKLIAETGTSIVKDIKNIVDYDTENYGSEPVIKVETPNRNDPCPCGSGKKYKKCCIDIDQSIINKL